MVARLKLMEDNGSIPMVERIWTPTGDRVVIYTVGEDGHSKTGHILTPLEARVVGLLLLAETPDVAFPTRENAADE